MYSTRVEQLGTYLRGCVNSTYLKNRILAHFIDLQALKEGQNVLLIFSEYVGPGMRKTCEHDIDTDAIHMLQHENQFHR